MSMPPARPGHEVGVIAVVWAEAWRVVASRYPPINLFERVSSDPAVWEVLIELEQLTNARVRDEIGEISRVPPKRRISGPNASWVMATFTHVNPRGSRFSDGRYGVYYAADRLKTAIVETAYHFGRFARDSHDPPRREGMRVLLGSVDNEFHNLGQLSPERRSTILDPDSYVESQRLGHELRASGSNGVVYPSVRDRGGRCLAAFWPDVVRPPMQERHLTYEWDGARVSRYFDYLLGTWTAL